jgi:leucyl aminopeptidase
MPLNEAADLAEELKSPIADLKNLGGRYAGSVTAALFLKEFVATDKVGRAAA